MNKRRMQRIFEKQGAVRKGHFPLASGKHSGEYLDKTAIYPDGKMISAICSEMADEVGKAFPEWAHKRVEAVVGPAMGGIILAHEAAKRLSKIYGKKVYSVFTEKDDKGNQALQRQAFRKRVAGSLVLVVDDILTTGGSVNGVIRAVQEAGGHVIAVAVICNRGGVKSSDIMDYPLFWLWETDIESWEPKDCPLCKQNIPLEDPKSR